jgi:ATP-dependent Zn protease
MKTTEISNHFLQFFHNYSGHIIFYLLFALFLFTLLQTRIYLSSKRALQKAESSTSETSKLFWLQKSISYSNHLIPVQNKPVKTALQSANISSQKNPAMEKQYLSVIKSGLENSGIFVAKPSLHKKINKRLSLLKANSNTTEESAINMQFSGIISILCLLLWVFAIFMFTFRSLNKKLELNIAKAKFFFQ